MRWALLFQTFCSGDLLLAYNNHMLSENCCAPSLAVASRAGCCCRGSVPWTWLPLPKSGHPRPEDGWVLEERDRISSPLSLLLPSNLLQTALHFNI